MNMEENIGLITALSSAGKSDVFHSDLYAEEEKKDQEWTFDKEEMRWMAMYGSQKDLDQYIQKLREKISVEKTGSLMDSEQHLARIFQARRYLDAANLTAAESSSLNGRSLCRRMSEEKLRAMSRKIYLLHLQSGSFHGTRQDEEAFIEHIYNNLQYMNMHGMQGMLRRAQQQYEDPASYEKIMNALKENSGDINYSDRLVMERKNAGMNQKANHSEEKMIQKLNEQSTALDNLAKSIRKAGMNAHEPVEEVIKRAAAENGMRASSWANHDRKDVRVLVELCRDRQLELKVGGKTAEQVADHIQNIGRECRLRIDILQKNNSVKQGSVHERQKVQMMR